MNHWATIGFGLSFMGLDVEMCLFFIKKTKKAYWVGKRGVDLDYKR